MPKSDRFGYLVQGRCSITHYPEYQMLRSENAKSLAQWIYEDILCCWGTLVEIVSENGPAFVKALAEIERRYHITHIRISGYNSRANGIAERPHFDVRQALYKASNGEQSKWSSSTYAVFWADRITVRRRMGCSPFFAVTGAHPLLPFDIVESTYLRPPPNGLISSTNLIAEQAIALQKCRDDLEILHSKVFEARVKAA